MELIGQLISELGRCLCLNVGRQVNHLQRLQEDMGTLKTSMEWLCSLQNDVKIELDTAEVRQGMRPKNEVQEWLRQVEKLKNDVESIERQLVERRCTNCFCYYCSRLKIAKCVMKKIEVAAKLQEKRKFSDGLINGIMLYSGKTFPAAPLFGKTAEKTSKTIWDCLKSTEIQKIGLYGMGGVGKTTIMKHINNCINKENLFNYVIWVTVSKSRSLEGLQCDIAKAIELDLSENVDKETRSVELFEALNRRKNFLLILDDMWEPFPLEEIGMPVPNEEKNCKVVITTRDLCVCRGMETQKNIEVGVLSKEEAWELFKSKVGDAVVSQKLEEIAKLVVGECGGLPLAIVTVGRALRQVDELSVWRNALDELKNSSTEIRGMEANVFAHLKFSYIRLRSNELKYCFLYCSLYPEDYEIPTRELVKCWIYEGFINDRRNGEEEIDKGYALLDELKCACLLESLVNRYDIECVKMHDLIRDMAINITRVNPRFMVKAGIDLKEIPTKEESIEDVERISLMQNKILLASGEPNCPKLLTLFLQQNHQLKKISHSFFDNMLNLRVLNLSHTKIKDLPLSLTNLSSLRALLLHSCHKLMKVPPLAKLKSLKALDLYYTGIRELPQGMEELVNLRHLNLSRTFNLKMIPVGVILNLSHLEDLLMYRSEYKWSWTSSGMGGRASIEEIIKSTHLANLHIHFVDLASFSSYIKTGHWRLMKNFHLTVGQVSDLLPLDTSKRNYIVEIGGFYIVDCSNSMTLPCNTQNLAIENCDDIVELSEWQCLLHLNDLKECHVFRCNAIEYILTMEESTLATLEVLDLWKLPRLRAICKGVRQYASLECLMILKVDGCDNLKSLLPIKVLHHLKNLEEVQIKDCSIMEEIIAGVEEEQEVMEDNSIMLPRLKSLVLECLPKLSSICPREIICNSLETIAVTNCLKLKKLPFFIDSLHPALKVIKGSRKWVDMVDCNDPNIKSKLEHFFKEEKDDNSDDGL